ncbi:helix-turn-helix domain-containing protein [Natronococcus wangiae]|uniref:MarR family transcriptional regulator n=1 Tax=Natronococcus wangiae TaxID=3068275 RepID=UPI00273EAFE8|nr:MarR family transcriptional regulator [Natronococcus sp. AD5]
MMEQQLTTERLDPIPAELDSPQGKLVYLYLEATGGATATDLNEALAMKKIAVLSILNSLSSQGLVEKDGDVYVPRD